MAIRQLRRSANNRHRGVVSTNNFYDTAFYDFATYGAGGNPPGGGEDGWTERLDLPFNVPPRALFEASPYKVMPHWFAVTDHRIRAIVANQTYGNRVSPTLEAPDYFDNNFLPDPLPGSTDGSIPAGVSTYRTVGGYWRNRAQRYPPTQTPMGRRDRQREARDAYNWYMSGMLVENTSNSAATALEAYDAVVSENLAGQLKLRLMPDFSTLSGLYNNTAQQTATMLQLFWGHAAQEKINGRMQIVVFYPENKPLQHWVDVIALMNAAGKPIDMDACYVGSGTRNVYGAGGYAEEYASVFRRHGRWGGRDPINVDSGSATSTQNRWQAWASDRQAGLTPGKSLGYVAPGDERPKSRRYHENRLFATLMVSWDVILNGNGQGHSVKFDGSDPVGNSNPARPDLIQIPTWSDQSEGSEIWPSRNCGYNHLILSLYYMISLMATDNVPPTIKRDCLFLHHRVQFTSGMTYTSPYATSNNWFRDGSTANANVIGVLVFAKSDCIVRLTVNGVATTKSFSAGMHVWGDIMGLDASNPMPPLQAGAAGNIKVEMLRNNAVVQETGLRGVHDVALTSPWAVSHTNYSPDYAQRGGNSLMGWPLVDFDIPDQTHKAIT